MEEYKEIQNSEKESLSYLYNIGTEMRYINDNAFTIFLDNPNNNIDITLFFEYPEKYPADPPLVKIIKGTNVNDTIKATVEEKINNVINENIGFPMVYTIAEAIRTVLSSLKGDGSYYDDFASRNKGVRCADDETLCENHSSDETEERVGKKKKEFSGGELYRKKWNSTKQENYAGLEYFSEENVYRSKDISDIDDIFKDEEEVDDDQTHYDNVLATKELCDEKFRVSEEEFNDWRQEFYKDMLMCEHDKYDPDNPTGREIFSK